MKVCSRTMVGREAKWRGIKVFSLVRHFSVRFPYKIKYVRDANLRESVWDMAEIHPL